MNLERLEREADALLAARLAPQPSARKPRRRDWRNHDRGIPFRDERLMRLNGSNPAGRRPHSFIEPQLKPVTAMLATESEAA